MHFSPTQNLPKTESVMGYWSVSPFNTMAASIEKSLAKILEAMEEIKNCISNLEVKNMRLQQSPTPLLLDIAYSPKDR